MFPFAITHPIWIPIEIILYVIVGNYSKKNNDAHHRGDEAASKKFWWITTLLGAIPLWAFVAPDSSNLAVDGLLYDIIMILTMTSTLLFLNNKFKMKAISWVGLTLIIIGFSMMKL